MISSEVQRTLVKSPPELWAELSSPEGLARHLGELGEIRITATEPESRVEWRAAGTAGTVLIKASGWGTKVTLSAMREVELPASAEHEQDEPDEPPQEPHAPGDLGAGGPPAPADGAAPAPYAPADEAAPGHGTRDGDGAAAQERPADEAAPGHDLRAGDEPAGEILLRPHTVAGRWEAHATSHQEAAAPERSPALAQWSAQVEPAPEAGAPSEAEDGEAFVERAPQPAPEAARPGFFARLFRRRRAAAAEETFAAEPTSGETRPGPAGAGGPEPADLVAEDGPPQPDPAAQTPPAGEAAVEEVPVHPAEPAAPADAGLPRAAAPLAEPAAPADAEPAQAPDAAEAARPADPAPPAEPGPRAAPPQAAGPEHRADTPEQAPENAGAGISAELKAAEEAATAEVTAVLTAALDSLGAAHHRPFSRG